MQNLYLEVLELSPGATKSEVKSAYRRLSKRYHPDVNKDDNANEKFIEVNEAYKFLTGVGPRPVTINQAAPSYDYDVQDHAYDDWRRKAKAYARKKAEDELRRQEYLTKTFLKVFESVSLVLTLINLILVVDLILPNKTQLGRQVDSTVFWENHYGYYESLWIDEYEFKVKKNELNFLFVDANIDRVRLYTTAIFNQPIKAEFEIAWKTYAIRQFAGVFGFFSFIPFLLVGVWSLYKLIRTTLDAQLSLSVIYIFLIFMEIIIYLISQ
ncbi:MAG: DnaJ domain-containing protein [Reichenbachiella sp.]|nr:DnaJ domain-containing protein [Reichenbachiella sp.]MDW3209036.1 DnaJ domain-containing protein [Reichenbachiella sp.]